MNLFRTLSGAALVLSIGAGMTSCLQDHDYAIEPHIEEKAVTVFRKNDAFGLRDSVEIALNFEDGDGDLGLDGSDTTGVLGIRTNRFFNNFFVQAYTKNSAGTLVPLPLPPGFTYNGRFIRLTKTDTRPGPIKGVLRYAIPFSLFNPLTVSGTEMQFVVSIADRALHESNKVTTSTITL